MFRVSLCGKNKHRLTITRRPSTNRTGQACKTSWRESSERTYSQAAVHPIQVKPMKESCNVFRAGLYLRLSREDENDGVSGSIQNQRDFLTRYCLQRGFTIVDVYADDGWSGTSFDRPDWKRLIVDIESGRINCVVTKDLSRLGRDYIMTGYYLEKYFPERRVRYVAVNDSIDTFEDSGGNDLSPFRSVINDMYARDISKKVRTALHTKKLNGHFIGSVPPYGYRKSTEDKHRLVIDEETAPVVRRIYQMFISGGSKLGIANQLTAEGVPTPSQVKQLTATQKRHPGVWNEVIIHRILRNPTYIGNLTQNRARKINYKVDTKMELPESDWIVVEGTHDPIVSAEDFNLARRLSDKRSYVSRRNGAAHLLSGLACCGTCGGRMTFAHETGQRIYMVCAAWRKHPKLGLCTSHSCREADVNARVLAALRKEARSLDKGQIAEAAMQTDRPAAAPQTELDHLRGQLEEIKTVLSHLYMDKARGVVTEADFLDMSARFGEKRETIARRMQNIEVEMNRRRPGNDREQMVAALERFLTFKQPDRAALVVLIDSVEVFPDKRIRIHYNFRT